MSRLIQELLAAVPAPRPESAPSARAAGASPRRSRTRPARRKATFSLEAELLVALRRLCEQEGCTQREVVERLLAAHVARHRHKLETRRGR